MPVGVTRLRIAGFKSFAEPLTIDVREGLTGLIGPNGCGKSNVVEALRWVMGESSAKSLRGGEMDDVIFAGTAHRPARNLAEVAITLAVEEGQLFPPPFESQSELEITRRIERGSGSVYRLNGKEARARDVQTLFADLGSGARASAMVSQGRVGLLIGAAPAERRSMLEEAAGIGGLHARRHEAELKLRAAEANAERAEDLRTQLDAQRESLGRQAKQAARHHSLSGLIRGAEAEHLSIRLARAEAARQAARQALGGSAATVQAAAGQARQAQQAADAAQEVLPDLREADAGCRTTLERAKLAAELADKEIGRARTLLAAARAQHGRIAQDVEHASRMCADAGAAERRLGTEAEALAGEQAADPGREQREAATLAEADAALREQDGQAHHATEAAALVVARTDALTASLAHAESQLRRIAGVEAALANELGGLQPVPATQLAAAQDRVEAARLQVGQLQEVLHQVEQQRDRTRAAHHTARTALHAAETPRARLAAEVQALTELVRVQAHGSTALVDRLTVPPGLEAAVGAALGDELELPDQPAGPRHFRALPPLDPEPALPPGVACLADRVGAPPALGRRLRQTGLVEPSQGQALQAALLPGQVLVSSEGAAWRWDGYVQAPDAPTAAAVRLQQRNRLAVARQALAEADASLAAAQQQARAADEAERTAQQAEPPARHALRRAEADAQAASGEQAALQRKADTAAARHGVVQAQLEQARAEHAEAATARATQAGALAALPSATEARATVAAVRAALATARLGEQAARAALEETRRRAAARQARLRSILGERAEWSRRAQEAADRQAELATRQQEAALQEQALAGEPERLEQARTDAAAALQEAERAFRVSHTQLAEADRTATATTKAAHAAHEMLTTVREAAVRNEAEAAAADRAWGVVAERVLERFGTDPALPPAPALTEDAEDRARRKHERLARERDEMGPVNLRAELELAEIDHRLATLDAERADLHTAIAKLRGSIGHLNREGRERLATVFADVDRHFQALFTRMFNGGKAHLAMVGSDDPLQAGLEIYAQPPGKKLATLSLLSGGEQALTALSLIFAVFCCNPAPVSVLDEVDAPLDDANIQRFCAMLEDMVRQTGTRFLVVTHHHLTMARMDRLYGVTMQERGVSRLLSVDLAHASRMIDPVAIAAE